MYLLKTKTKENLDLSVAIGLKSKYHEFENIEDIISFLFTNAPFIASYKIYEAKEFSTKSQQSQGNTLSDENYGQGSLNISSSEGFGRFS